MKIYHVIKFLKFEYSIKDIIDFFRGNIRYWFYYHNKFFIRKHILEQIEYRVSVMDRECYNSGSCKICGCNTIHLQMANKSCEGNCYPKMMNKKDWRKLKK
jgi:hypothetical protein